MSHTNTTQPTQEMIDEQDRIEKTVALSHLLECDSDDIEQSDYNATTFEAEGEEYLVCTDEEADDMAADYIKESLWAFNPGFIIDHSELPYDAFDMIADLQEAKCEDANEIIFALITDLPEFIEDAIASDGRGHFLNGYDGDEYESNGFYIYQI